MKNARKLMASLIALIFVFMMAVPQAQAWSPTDKTTDLVITKLVPTTPNVTLAPVNHDGTQKDTSYWSTTLGQSVTTLSGAGFTLYKVTDGSTLDQAISQVNGGGALATIAQQVTGSDGTTTFLNLADGTYLIKETLIPEGSQPVAVPALITLPLANVAGTVNLDPVYIYPKNIQSTITPTKTVDTMTNMHSTHDVGDTQTWYLQATAPANLADWEGLKFTDVFSTKLNYANSVKIGYAKANVFTEITTLVSGTDYTLTQPTVGTAGGTMTLEFTLAGIKKLAGIITTNAADEIVVTVNTVINETAVMGTVIPNTYTLSYDNTIDGTTKYTDKPSDKPDVVTGGRKFVKVDANTTTKRLSGAEFVVSNTVGGVTTYLKVETDKRTWVTDKSQATTFTSDVNGLIDVKGLEYSEFTNTDGVTITNSYALEEMKAPSGYAVREPFAFIVDKDSYTTGKIASLPDGTALDATMIDNKPMTIPQTGGIGTAIFIVAGLAIMGGAAFAMKKENEKE